MTLDNNKTTGDEINAAEWNEAATAANKVTDQTLTSSDWGNSLNGTFNILTPAASGAREQILSAYTGESTYSSFGVGNFTSSTNVFIPLFYGFNNDDNRAGLSFLGLTSSDSTTSDQNVGLIDFNCGLISTDNSDPLNATRSQLSSSMLFTFRNDGSNVMNITAGGQLGINTTEPMNRFQVDHTGVDGDNGFMIVRQDSTVGEGNNLGGIGFDSTDGNTPSSVLESSAYINAYSAEPQGDGDKGGHLTFGTAPINQNDDSTSVERVRITSEGNVGIGTSTPEQKLEVAGNIKINGNYVIDGTVSGMSTGDIGYFNGTNWVQADASAESSASKMLGINLGGDSISVQGIYTTTGLTAGDIYYLSETAGAITNTAPSTSLSVVRVVGYALSTTELYFCPDNTWVEVA